MIVSNCLLQLFECPFVNIKGFFKFNTCSEITSVDKFPSVLHKNTELVLIIPIINDFFDQKSLLCISIYFCNINVLLSGGHFPGSSFAKYLIFWFMTELIIAYLGKKIFSFFISDIFGFKFIFSLFFTWFRFTSWALLAIRRYNHFGWIFLHLKSLFSRLRRLRFICLISSSKRRIFLLTWQFLLLPKTCGLWLIAHLLLILILLWIAFLLLLKLLIISFMTVSLCLEVLEFRFKIWILPAFWIYLLLIIRYLLIYLIISMNIVLRKFIIFISLWNIFLTWIKVWTGSVLLMT